MLIAKSKQADDHSRESTRFLVGRCLQTEQNQKTLIAKIGTLSLSTASLACNKTAVTVDFSSRWYLKCSGDSICNPPDISEVFSKLLLESLQVEVTVDGPTWSFQDRLSSTASSLRLAPKGDQCCDVLGVTVERNRVTTVVTRLWFDVLRSF